MFATDPVLLVYRNISSVDSHKLLTQKRSKTVDFFRPQGRIVGSAPGYFLERLKDGNIHMCFFSRSGYRPFINPPPSLGNLLLDITLCSISFRCRFVSFNFRVRVSYLGLGLGLGIGFGIGNLKIFDRWRCRHS